MKSMNKRESKKIAVMAAVIVGLMMFAFMPAASAEVTSFTVEPGTGIAGAVDSYNVLVTTDGVTSINITIPAGFIAVTPTTGGVEIARVDFWNESTKAYYGYATITASDTNPTTKVDVYCEFGGETITKSQNVNYAAGALNTFVSGFVGDTSVAIIRLPTETAEGSIKIAIDCTLFQLEDVMIAIKQFVRNPSAGNYVFSADGVNETVTIAGPLAYPTGYESGMWYVDSDGDLLADIYFSYGGPGADIIPLVGNLGSLDTIVFNDSDGMWYVDTDRDRVADLQFLYGAPGHVPLVGDVNQDGSDDIVIFSNGCWFVDTTGNHIADQVFMYGTVGDIPILGDVDQDGKIDRVVVDTGGVWHVDTDMSGTSNIDFVYGAVGDKPLVGDLDRDGKDDIVAVDNLGVWHVDTNKDYLANLNFLYGTAAMTPLAGEIR